MAITLLVNGEQAIVHVPPLTPLVKVLREHLALTGTKAACQEGFCGSCTVLIDGAPIVSCLLPVGLVGVKAIRTVESLAPGDGTLTPLQQGLKDVDAVQCGMCFPGVLMTLTALIEEHVYPSREDVRQQLVGNICRCTGYEQIIASALRTLSSSDENETVGIEL